MTHVHNSASRRQHEPATSGRLIHWARLYDPFVSIFTLGRRARMRQATADLARIQPGERVLEVGCGTGDVALAVSPRALAVCGIDPSHEMISVAREKAAHAGRAVDFQVGVIEALAFPNASFDIVLSSLMMHHLPSELKQRGLAEIARVLKPGGRLLIVDFKRPNTHRSHLLNRLVFHGMLREGVQELPALLSENGFDVLQSGDLGVGRIGFVLAQFGYSD